MFGLGLVQGFLIFDFLLELGINATLYHSFLMGLYITALFAVCSWIGYMLLVRLFKWYKPDIELPAH